MPVTVGCQNCRQRFQVPKSLAWRCPKCGRSIERACPKPGDPANLNQPGNRLLSDEEVSFLTGLDVRNGGVRKG